MGDFKDAKLYWVDLREKEKRAGRSIETAHWNDLGGVSEGDLVDYMANLLDAFRIFDEEKRKRSAAERATKHVSLPLFDVDHI